MTRDSYCGILARGNGWRKRDFEDRDLEQVGWLSVEPSFFLLGKAQKPLGGSREGLQCSRSGSCVSAFMATSPILVSQWNSVATTLFPTSRAMLNVCQTASSLAHPSEGTSNPGPAALIDLGPALIPARSSGAVGQRL